MTEKNICLESANGIVILDGTPTRYETLMARIKKPSEHCLLKTTWIGTGCAGEDSTLIISGELRVTCRNIDDYGAAPLKIRGEINGTAVGMEGLTLNIFGVLHIKYV